MARHANRGLRHHMTGQRPECRAIELQNPSRSLLPEGGVSSLDRNDRQLGSPV
jgi:hypothetical protein